MNQSSTDNILSKEFIILMAALMSIVALSIDAMLPALGIMGTDLNVTEPNHAQYIISFIFAGMAIGQLISGPLSDAIGRKTILYIGLIIYMIGGFICLLSQNIEMMLLGRFIQGLGVSAPYVASVSIVRDKYSGRAMARVMSLVMMIFIMVPTIAPALGQGLMYLGSWHYIFVLYICYACVIMFWVTLRLKETLTPENRISFSFANIFHGIKVIFCTRSTVFYTLAMGCVFGAMVGYLSSCQQIYQVQFQKGDMFVVYFGLQAMAFGVSSLVNSRLVERLGMRHIAIRALLAILMASVIFYTAIHFVEVQFWMFFVFVVILLFNLGLIFGNLNALAMEPMGHIAGIAASIIGCMSSIISITLGTTIGQFYDGTLNPIILGFMALAILALTAIYFADNKKS